MYVRSGCRLGSRGTTVCMVILNHLEPPIGWVRERERERVGHSGDHTTTQGGVPSSPARRVPDSPIRECGSPPWSGRVAAHQGPAGSLSLSRGRCGAPRSMQVASSRQWQVHNRIGNESKPYNPSREEDEILSFWGQLWYIPNL